MRYEYRPFDYAPPLGLSGPEPRHPVAIVGAGPIGLALAIDLAQRGVPSVVLDDNNVVSRGSRAICWAKRTLEIFDRLGVGERMLAKGVTWKVGRVFHGDDEVWNFDLLPEDGHKFPAFINLQQYYAEQYLVERAQAFPGLISLRFLNKVVAHEDRGDHVGLRIETPDGTYGLEASWLVACDGARSPTRERMGLAFEGEDFEERFLIADVEMAQSPYRSPDVHERWFWFDPTFHAGKSALLHAQPDDIYRIDLQLGPEADPVAEATEERVFPRIRAIVGDTPFKLDWMSVYRFRCARLERFLHGRVIFAGDSAHVVSPFGARGGNGGIQDIDNLGWKLAAVLSGVAGEALLESYEAERIHGADENIANSARATNFMTPKTPAEAQFRAEVLRMARRLPFARRLINSGRLSVPCSYEGMALQTPGEGRVPSGVCPPDAPLPGGGWLLDCLRGEFTLLGIGTEAPEVPGVVSRSLPAEGLLAERYGRAAYLFRPDGVVAASFAAPTPEAVAEARDRALGRGRAQAVDE